MTEIEVFRSAGTLMFEVKVPSQQPGISKSWVRLSPGIEQYARQSIRTETDNQNLETASSHPSVSCVRPRARETDGNS